MLCEKTVSKHLYHILYQITTYCFQVTNDKTAVLQENQAVYVV